MNPRQLSIIAGLSYLVIFFAAIFANFFVLESLLAAPLETVQQNNLMVRFGAMAFLVAAVFDVVVAWALYLLFKKHPLTNLSTYFRIMHAAIMGIAVFALMLTVSLTTAAEILKQVKIFNMMWLIGLFFFGIHLILLGKILQKPSFIVFFLILAGAMYLLDTAAHFLLVNYDEYSSIFLTLVAIPSVIGEMSLAVWLLVKGGKSKLKELK